MTELSPDLCEKQVIKDYFLNKGTHKITDISIFAVQNEKQVLHVSPSGILALLEIKLAIYQVWIISGSGG